MLGLETVLFILIVLGLGLMLGATSERRIEDDLPLQAFVLWFFCWRSRRRWARRPLRSCILIATFCAAYLDSGSGYLQAGGTMSETTLERDVGLHLPKGERRRQQRSAALGPLPRRRRPPAAQSR